MKMIQILLLIFLPFYFSYSEKTEYNKQDFPEQIVHMLKKMQNQRKEIPSFQKKIELYDSQKDPFFRDKEIESNSRITKTTYLQNHKRQILIHEKEIVQLAPPSPTYTWYNEYYFEKDRLYSVCFRYLLTMPNDSYDTKLAATDIIVFFQKNSKPMAYKRTYPLSKVESLKPMVLDESYSKMDYEEIDESGMTIAALRDGVEEVVKAKNSKR